MTGRQFHLVDVFAERKYAGNQLAVVEDAGGLADDERQAIAREMNFSETTFVDEVDPGERLAAVRIFTPREEIPFAGHPTLGTAFVVRERYLAGASELSLSLPAGDIPVRVEHDGRSETYWMTQQPPEFGETLSHDSVARMLSLDQDDLDGDWPVQVVSTGLPTIIVPLVSQDALRRSLIDRPRYDEVTGERDAKNVLVFCPEPRHDANDFAVRMFSPFHGLPEDPATGSSNGCLAGYLVKHRYFEASTIAVRVEQGYEMGRPSLLHLSAGEDGNEITVEVGGGVVPVAMGRLR